VAESAYPGVRIESSGELLRRVAPGGKVLASDEAPGSEAFKPNPAASAFQPARRNTRDNGGLSTKRESEDPETAYWQYLKAAGDPGSRWAYGVWGFTVGQADSLQLPAFDDSGINDLPQRHATVWFPMPADISNAKLKLMHDVIAESLLEHAIAHGCLYRPEDPHADARSLQVPTR
jgi:hypothetical protein